MKKGLALIMTVLVGSVLVAGCAGNGMNVSSDSKYAGEFKDAPQWVKDGGGSLEGGQAAVGSAAIGKAGVGFARTEAQAQARDELARQMQIKVKNLVEQFTQQIGMADSQTVDKVVADVSKQVANQTLSGSRVKDTWISPSDTLYTLMIIDNEVIKTTTKNAVATSFKNDEAAWQKFQAEEGFERLQEEIEKEFEDNR